MQGLDPLWFAFEDLSLFDSIVFLEVDDAHLHKPIDALNTFPCELAPKDHRRPRDVYLNAVKENSDGE